MTESTNIESVNKTVEFLNRLGLLNRVLYPGLAVALFLEHRYNAPVFRGFGGESLPSITLSLLLGALVYFMYRAVVHPIVWFFQARTLVGMPSREAHRRIVDKIRNDLVGTPIRDSVFFSQACLAQFQTQFLSPQRRASTTTFNAGSHILYLTATIGFLLLLHDTTLWPLWIHADPRNDPTIIELIAWCILFVFGLVAAVIYDRMADYREVIAVWQNEGQYQSLLETVLRSWPTGQHRFTWSERMMYIIGDGGLIAVICFATYVGIKVIRHEWPLFWLLGAVVLVLLWWFVAANRLFRARSKWRSNKEGV